MDASGASKRTAASFVRLGERYMAIALFQAIAVQSANAACADPPA
jgi:D-alanyl-D-alanine carboxypeptidase